MLIVVEVVYTYAQSFQSCLTLCDPLDCSHQVPLFMGFFSREYCSGLSFPPPGESSYPCLLHCRWILCSLSHLGNPGEIQFSSVQFSRSVMSGSLWPHESQHARPPCPSPTPGVYQNIFIELVMPSNHLILCHPLLLLPSIFPNVRVISNESVLHIRWPKYWSFSFNISPSNEDPGLISFRMDWLDLLVVQGTLKSILQHHSSKASILLCSAL